MNTFLQGLQQDIWRWLFRSLVTLTTCSSHLPVFGEQHERHHVCGHHTGAACEICIKENWMKVLREIEKKDLVSARSAHGITMQLQWTLHWNAHMHILEASISRVVLPFSCLPQYFANTITRFCLYHIIIITALMYRIAGKCQGLLFFLYSNLVV